MHEIRSPVEPDGWARDRLKVERRAAVQRASGVVPRRLRNPRDVVPVP